MNARDVPRCMRGNLALSEAQENGRRAGLALLSRDVNPHEDGPKARAWDQGWRSSHTQPWKG